jgi:transcriptional regulator with XRE-family HTH domain
MSHSPNTLAEFMRQRRERHDGSPSGAVVADALGLSRQTINHYECGRVTPPAHVLRAWMEFFGVPEEERAEVWGLLADASAAAKAVANA